MALKWCTKLDIVSKRCHIVLQGHMLNFKATWGKHRQFWPTLKVSGLYLQFEFTDGFEMMHKALRNIEEVPCCFSRSNIEFLGHTDLKIYHLNPILSKVPSPVAAIKSLRFVLLLSKSARGTEAWSNAIVYIIAQVTIIQTWMVEMMYNPSRLVYPDILVAKRFKYSAMWVIWICESAYYNRALVFRQ